MLDGQLYGRSAGGYHGTNAVLHAATAVLLFLVWRQMTDFVAERRRGGAVRYPSFASGIGGLGDGAEGRPQRALLRVDAGRVRSLRAQALFAGALTRSFPRSLLWV